MRDKLKAMAESTAKVINLQEWVAIAALIEHDLNKAWEMGYTQAAEEAGLMEEEG